LYFCPNKIKTIFEMKLFLTTIGLIATISYSFSQCVSTKIPKTGWTVHYVDSEETTGEGPNNGKAIYAIDGDTTKFWHTRWQGAQPDFPHEIQINLGAPHDVSGISLLSRYNNALGKPKAYEVYVSNDGTNWQTAQSAGDLIYPSLNAAAQRANVYFGAVSASFVRFRFLNSYGNYYYLAVSEIDVYEDLTCPATGQMNQLASFDAVPKKYTTDAPFALNATTNSGLPITFEIVSGPATVNGNIVTLTGAHGTVVVKAKQVGNATYYPWEQTHSFQVVDLTEIQPVVATRFTSVEDLRMPSLKPYLLHAYATIDEPQALSVTAIDYIIDGVTHPATWSNNSWQYWWTPSQYGTNQVIVKATGSNGKVGYDTIQMNVVNTASSTIATTFLNNVIDMGTIGSQWFYGSYTLPQSVGTFESIIADFAISCPNVPGGCDDWDRLGWVEVKGPSGEWIELFRYITPYGVPCSQSIDVTDYESILQGKVEFRMYIETWGTGGWKLNLKLNYNAGTPTHLYSSVQELWHGDYSFGDPANLQPTQSRSVQFEDNVIASKIRLVSTGHGWGSNNTGNAAEFYHAKHHIHVNNVETFEQDLWQNCNPNPAGCTGQQGTWQHNRAGWCPGSMGMVFSYDLTPYLAQDIVQLGYIFQESYVDYCHPNNPNCISGTTCQDCNASYNPYYRVGAYVVKFSDAPFTLSIKDKIAQSEMTANLYPNPTSNHFNITLNGSWKRPVVSVLNIAGEVVKTYFFTDEKALNNTNFNVEDFTSGVYFIKVQSEGQFTTMKMIKQ
jgi:hypothetical protein